MLNKWNLKVADFASKEESRYQLQSVLVTPQATVATNGHYLVWVSTPDGMHAEQFPVIDHAPTVQDDFPPFLLSVDDAKKVEKALPRKSTIPILTTAGVAVKDGQPIIEVTDLECPQVFRPAKPQGTFPPYEQIIPSKKPTFQIAVNAAYLAKIAKMAADFRADDGESRAMVMSFYGKDEAIRFDVDGNGRQGMTAMLMPIQLESATTHGDVPLSHGWKEREAAREKEREKAEEA